MLEQGPVEKRIIAQALRAREPLPTKIANAPELRLGLELYWDAFWDLDTCRLSGFSMGPIPWLAIKDYGLTFELDDDQTESLFYLIREMDNVFREHHQPEKAKKPWQRETQATSQRGWRSSPKR